MFQVSSTKSHIPLTPNSEYSTQNFIPQKHLESYQHSFVTELSADHYPTEAEGELMSTLINKLQGTDSIADAKKLTNEIKTAAQKLADSIQEMRSHYFTVEKEGTDLVYGRMAEGYTDSDRDKYIRALHLYFQCDNELKSLPNDLDFSIKRMAAPHHSGQVYGDWKALENLIKGQSAVLPDLTYNRGSTQFG